MEDKPISIRLGVRRLAALKRYLADNEGETRNGVIAGAVEEYLKATGYWEAPLEAQGIATAGFGARRPTLSERVAALEEAVARLRVEATEKQD